MSIPVNPRTGRPVGYAFVDLETAEDAEKAINNLSGKEILERKVSVQVARKRDSVGEAAAGANSTEPTSGGEVSKKGYGRGRGRGRTRGGRSARGGRPVRHAVDYDQWNLLTHQKATAENAENGDNGEKAESQPLTDVTNEANQAPPEAPKEQKPRTPRPPKQRGPPEDGIPSTTKVMVANLPYDFSEDKVRPL